MRDIKDTQLFLKNLDERCNWILSDLDFSELLSSLVPPSRNRATKKHPNRKPVTDVDQNFEYYFRPKFGTKRLKLIDLYKLCILSWYLPKEFRILTQIWLEEKILTLEPEDRIVPTILLSSQGEMKLFLIETKTWSIRTFFGNILTKELTFIETNTKNRPVTTIERKINIKEWFPKSFWFQPRKATRPKRKRGYDDKGSLKPEHRWKPDYCATLTDLQNQLEELEIQSKQTLQFLQGWLR